MRSSSIFSRVASRSRVVSIDADRGFDELGEVRERRVFANAHSQHETLRFAIFGDERDAGIDAVLGLADAHAACRRSKSRRGRGTSAPATARTISVRPAPTKPARPTISPARTENDTSRTTGARTRSRTSSTTGAAAGERQDLGKVRVEFAPDHRAYDLVRRKVRDRARFDRMTVAQDRDAVGDARQFFQAMRNVDDTRTAAL